MNLKFLIPILLLTYLQFSALSSYAQANAVVYGNISNEYGKSLEFANISVKEHAGLGAVANFNGDYSIDLPVKTKLTLVFSYTGNSNREIEIILQPGEKRKINISLKTSDINLQDVEIISNRERSSNMIRLNPKVASTVISSSGSIETLIMSQPGVVSNNELSSQYSVRGGNFDENLVYVNDIEVYRPFLIRSGQQEGLSFVNPDLVSSVLFSAGGFESRYGDKMSSVLDIKYKRPVEFGASGSVSLLGGSIHAEGASDNQLFTYIAGARYKSNQYLLGSLDTKGDYAPVYYDFQTFMTYDLGTDFELNFLGHFSENSYYFVPQTRETSFGTIHEALKLKIFFEGQELDRFQTFTGALAGHYSPSSKTRLSLFISGFNTSEDETFDILGQYYLNELDNQLGSDNLGDSLANIGVGSFLNHARNYLDARVYSIYHKGLHRTENHFFQWGAQAQLELFQDRMNEWELLDSAGYSLPYSDSEVLLFRALRSDTSLTSQRLSAYFQDTYTFSTSKGDISLNSGFRIFYRPLNEEFFISPRINMAFKPRFERKNLDILFRLAAGYYYQPPFFHELKDLEGRINTDIESQKSIHFVLGSDYNFKAWDRPFKLVGEIYYKSLNDLILYDVDNVQIRYYGSNASAGYTRGIDFKINGEFVPGVDSWLSLSLMQSREKIVHPFSIEFRDSIIQIPASEGYIPRPTDQFFTFNLFFQDYFPKDSTVSMQLNLVYGSGLPFGPPNSFKEIADLRMPSYRRVDIGFSKLIIGDNSLLSRKSLRHIESIWLGLEIFNLLGIKNTVSYTWISDIRNHQYAVPNYLTDRRINVRLIVKL
jgi:hypothetical protein